MNPKSNQEFENSTYYVRYWMINDIVGRVLTVIETLGMPEKQEEATKSILKQVIYRISNDWIEIPQHLQSKVENLLESSR